MAEPRKVMAALALACLVVRGAVAADADVRSVDVEGMSFAPQVIEVRAGEKIVWRNKDLVPHTVTAAGAFDSRSIAPGASWSHRFDKPGEFEYVCSFHPGMKGRVIAK
ncbi:MAG TPA: cupredoxin family copper-binding protein [Burkholderiaceae bacterium]|nr:cupredoxin family copper-binding protein [Burkholderiaceae bacterium]